MTKPLTLSVFFPVYNEEENLPETVARTVRTLNDSPFIGGYEVILVNDGSKDGSAELAEELARTYPGVRVVHHRENRGYGEALKSGIAAAKMDYVFFTDADLQFDIRELNALLAYAADYPVVIGYRAPRRDPFLRKVNAWGWRLLNRLLFGLKVRDIDCAFKLFKRRLVQKLQLRSHGAMISAETLIRLIHEDVPVKEVPVSHLPRERGSPTGAKLSVIYRAFAEMVELYRGDLGTLASGNAGEAIRFMLVGVVNTVLDALLYIILTRGTVVFSEHLIAAKFFSFLGGTISSLFLNRSWTFGVKHKLTIGEVVRFYTTTSLSISANIFFMSVLVNLGMYDLLALAVTTVFTFGINFTLSKLWVFRTGRREKRYATP